MNEFDQNILTVSDNICKNIASIPDGERGFISQNILSNLRNLVEAVDQRIFSDIEPIELNCYMVNGILKNGTHIQCSLSDHYHQEREHCIRTNKKLRRIETTKIKTTKSG